MLLIDNGFKSQNLFSTLRFEAADTFAQSQNWEKISILSNYGNIKSSSVDGTVQTLGCYCVIF